MKKALLLPDGYVDLALSLTHWLEAQSDQQVLTVVHAFDNTADHPLKAAIYREIKQEATKILIRGLNFLPEAWSGQLHAELLLGSPELVLTIHLLLRRYDYLLMDIWQ